jgi:hypothetical protein
MSYHGSILGPSEMHTRPSSGRPQWVWVSIPIETRNLCI